MTTILAPGTRIRFGHTPGVVMARRQARLQPHIAEQNTGRLSAWIDYAPPRMVDQIGHYLVELETLDRRRVFLYRSEMEVENAAEAGSLP